jgi:multisubunit Na+/H+ antiporter MnhE subunit
VRRDRLLGFVAESVFWWSACLGVWLISLSAVSTGELIVATASSLPCGVIAALSRRAAGHAWHFALPWLRAALLLPVTIVSDTFQVLAAAVPRASSRRPGRFTEVALSGGAGDSPRGQGRRAAAIILTSTTPGSFVTEVDSEAGTMTVHVLAERGPRQEKQAVR